MRATFRNLTLPLCLMLALLPATACKKKQPKSAPQQIDAGTVDMNRDTTTDVDTGGFKPAPADDVEDTDLPANVEEMNRQLSRYVRDVYFGYDSSDLEAEARDSLTANATWLKAHARVRFKIEGHCDERGTREYNLALGERRAASVRNYLSALGIDGDRMQIVSYGEERPFSDGHDESSWSQNRRGHFVVTGL